MDIKPRLKDIREDNDKKQSEIAELLKTTRQYYSRYELNEIELPIRHYITLAQYYDVSIDYLCGLIDTPKNLKGEPCEIATNKIKNNININASGNNTKINIK